jgi:hypothetical protein
MSIKVFHCYYNQSDPKIKKLGDLKIEYATTKSEWIQSVLRQAEDLIIFKVGEMRILKARFKEHRQFTQEEMCFREKLKKVLK